MDTCTYKRCLILIVAVLNAVDLIEGKRQVDITRIGLHVLEILYSYVNKYWIPITELTI